ncbi:2-amino-4-hydroxy-6-hydroxymethyldihydropteridine diphosphokinase [Foetidibacter luteolus]|uniref:2-amino-4-hydroxy-6- hydroxymethyldihydropteridine diphosphokinase n=1 Tax=Foetidibacter luteolus TaxID=2608880 RepID=UPI00129A44D9|nr:2-amino-4-hydroxy-6-hydroxymethyldihydropteridine diphosphokinase [Foetidibacter luteolus]
MNKAYLLTGGNLGNRMDYLSKAQTLIEQLCGNIAATSAVYETAAWGLQEQPSFYNRLLVTETNLAPEKLMETLLLIEEQMGRKRSIKLGPRTIDLDVLMIDDLVINTPLLTLPHPQMHNRRFALIPFAEVAPNLVHPVFNKTIATLLTECPDTLDVHKIS